MSKLLFATAMALAIAAPVYADKGGNGGGHGNGGDHGGQSINSDRGHGGDKGGPSMRIEQRHGNRDIGHVMRDSGNGNHAMNDRGNRGGNIFRRADSGRHNATKSHGPERQVEAREIRDHQTRFVTRDFNEGWRGFANDCPPGLARKNNGCLPPGQASKLLGARLTSSFVNSQLPNQYRSWYRDDGNHFYRSGDGYIYQVNRSNNLVDGIIPLFGDRGYYALGDRWPQSYDFYNVPYQYRDYYADTGGYNYRYGDGAIYRVNSNSGVIDGIVALLAGDLGVGQQMPSGYDAYNVPFQYRDRYYDTADNLYRYNDGYIYRVDPKTRLIQAVINAII